MVGSFVISPLHSILTMVTGIPHLRIDQSTKFKNAAKRFRDDPTLLVLLLHGLVAIRTFFVVH